ncbi:MAG: 4-alpha-glucanotransferase [Fibrobacteres bacterium]|nr:4-alpha-glucanotransferase [Fibrobacterota bacterium]
MRNPKENPTGNPTLTETPPRKCPPPPFEKAWGWSVQLYALRSEGSWGIGDLADLRRLGEWSAGLGAGFLQVSPLSAPQPVPPLQPSPYYPSSRRFLSLLHLRIEDVPGAERAAMDLGPLAAQGRALNREPLIDRDAVFRLKSKALELLWPWFRVGRGNREDRAAFERFARESGPGLDRFAAHAALAEEFGPDWKKWPEEWKRPDARAMALVADRYGDRMDFHRWIQWLLDVQLEKASLAIALIKDLPIGFDPGGADAWAWQDCLDFGASVGAPPDLFNAQGQDWGLPPFIPRRLRASGYGPLRDTLRSVLRHAGGIRIDHFMGLFRLYRIPAGAKASEGSYVRYRHQEMLDVLAEECGRAGAFAVAEDLGTIEPVVRETMPERGILGSKVLWFETDPPRAFPHAALASLATHDLPTLAGRLHGRDDEEQAGLGLPVDPEGSWNAVERILAWAGLREDSRDREIVYRVHRMLAESPCALVAATLEDALGVERRPNLPGTVVERPNWRIPLPLTLEAIERDPRVLEIASALDRRSP